MPTKRTGTTKRAKQPTAADIENAIREATAILDVWTKEGSRVSLSTGLSGIDVEGTLHRFTVEDPCYWFRSLGGDVTKFIYADMMPSIDHLKNGKAVLRFGPSERDQVSLRLSPVQKKPPANLADVVRQFDIWASRKARVVAALDFGFATWCSLWTVEKINEEGWGLADDDAKHALVITPGSCASAKLRIDDDSMIVTLASEDGRFQVQITESEGDIPDPMQFMVSKLIH